MAFLDQRLKGESRHKIPQPSTYNRRFLWKVICIWLQATKSSALYVDIEQALTLSQKDQQSFLLIKQSTQSSSLSFQDAHEETSPESQLHLRKNLPKTISNCQEKCGKAITANEIPIVKPFGVKDHGHVEEAVRRNRSMVLFIYILNTLKNFDETHMHVPGEN